MIQQQRKDETITRRPRCLRLPRGNGEPHDEVRSAAEASTAFDVPPS